MEIHLFDDHIPAGMEIALPETSGRAIYVAAGSVAKDGATFDCDDGFLASGSLTIVAGPAGASLWRWELMDTSGLALGCRSLKRLSGPVPAHLTAENSFLRLDSVAFPPGGTAMLHTHQGPGIRCLREGSIRIDTHGASTSYGSGGAWYEEGPEPVFAQADYAVASRFIRASVLPNELLGKPSIRYVNEEDKDKPKSQSYRRYGEIGLAS